MKAQRGIYMKRFETNYEKILESEGLNPKVKKNLLKMLFKQILYVIKFIIYLKIEII